ncbi:MAG TPA: ATPase, T2SS/T4P/T4SS family [Actinomycetota bacterium]|nr:ATPase, T2SS/T4P/T4SS family [Actinomycetota bacterium]
MLFERVLDNDWLADLDPAHRRLAVRELLTPEERAAQGAAAAVAEVADHVDGYGPLTELMARPGVTDVLVNGPDDVWVEEDGELRATGAAWPDEDALRSFVDRLLASAGAGVDPAHPVADARLPDGARVHVVLPPIAPCGPLVSIRRFPSVRYTLDDLVDRRMLGAAEAERLAGLVAARAGIAISGATGSGKTTLLNALVSLVGPSERVVTLEETPELGPFETHVVSLVTRPPNLEGRGAVDLDTLVRASLRMRPNRIVVGEVRGSEAAAALAAMATGHAGSMITLHARSASDAPARLASLAAAGTPGADPAGIEDRVRRAIGAFVHVGRSNGTRRVEAISVA